MKKIFPVILLIAYSNLLGAQLLSLDPFNTERQKISKKGIRFLGTWAAGNIIYGTIAGSQATGSNKYFHQMNAVWNGVTAGIVAIGLLSNKKEGSLTLSESLKKQHSTEKLFLLNAGLDVAYIAGGAYLKEKGKTSDKNRDRLKGYGNSVMLQGGALLLFDGILYAIHQKHGKRLENFTNKIQLMAGGNQIGLVVHL